MTQATIDMTGQTVGSLQVIEYAPGHGRRAHWWCLCLACHHQQYERGNVLRKAMAREGFRVACRECGE
jgi:hypothetical protein